MSFIFVEVMFFEMSENKNPSKITCYTEAMHVYESRGNSLSVHLCCFESDVSWNSRDVPVYIDRSNKIATVDLARRA